MAIYSVQAPDGNIYDINGPEGASEADLFAATRQLMGQARAASLQQQIEELRTRQARPEEVSGFGAARAAGWQNLQADLAAVAGKTGIMSEEAAEKTIAEKKKEAARVFTPTENWSDAPWTKFKELVGGSLPYMAAPVAAGVAAAALPVVGVGGATAGLVGAGLAGLTSATQFTGSNLSRQLEEQEGEKSLAKTELAPAIAGAIPQAALDIVSFRMMPIVGRAFKSIGKELTEEQLKQVAERGLVNNMGRGGLKTGSVESLTETGQQLIERLQAGLSITDEKARAEYLESAIGGGALGFPLGALGGIGARGRARNKLAEIEAGRKPPEEEQKTGTALALMGERGVTVPETPTQETPVEFMGRENVPAAEQEQIRQLEDRTRVPTTAEAVRVNPDGTTGKVVANVPGAAPGQQGVLNIFDGEDVTARELGQRMGAVQQVPDVYPETNVPRLAAPATKDPRQGALQFSTPEETPSLSPRQRDTQRQQERQKLAEQRQQEFDLAQAQAEQQKQAELDKIANESQIRDNLERAGLVDEDARQEIKPGQPTQQEQLSLFSRKQAPTPSRAEGLRRGVGEQREELAPPQPQAIVTAQALDTLGIPKSAPAYRLSLGKDLADPEQRLSVSNTLRRLAANPNTKPDVRTNIENVLQMSPFVQVQGELFGPGGGKTNQPTLKTLEARNANVPESTGSTAEPAAESGASEPSVEVGGASVESKTGTESAAGVPKSKGRGLASADRGAKPDTAGKTKAQPAVAEEEELSQEEQDALQAELDAELAGEPVEAEATTEEQAKTKGIDWDFINKEIKRLKTKVANAERAESKAENAVASKAAKAKLAEVNKEFDAFLAKWNPIINAAADKTIAESEAKAKAKAEPEAEPETEPKAKKKTQVEPEAEEEEAAPNTAVTPFVPSDPDLPQTEKTLEYYKNTLNPQLRKNISYYEGLIAKGKQTKGTQARLDNARAHLAQNEAYIAKGPSDKATKAEPEAEIVNPEWEEITAKETNEYQKWYAANVQKYKHDDKKDIGERGDTDRRKVGSLLRGPAKAKQTTTSDLLARNSAWTYFSKMSRLVDNLRNIAFDIATNAPRFREGTQNIPASEAKFFKGMSATAAKHARRWVQANLSDAANAKLDEIVIAYKKEQLKFADKNFTDKLLGHDATREEYVEANDKDLVIVARALLDTDKPVVPRVRAPKTKAQVKAASKETIDTTSLGWDAPSMDDIVDNFGSDLAGQRKSFELNQDAVSRLGTPLHPAIRAMLEAGNLKGALDALAGQSSGIVQRIVQLLAGAVGGTRVEVVNNLVGEDGKPAAGLFDPATNTIRLDSKTGINNHTLIHEMTHGALSHILDNPNHPITRQLTKIFDSVKPFLDTAYGAQSLQEFVAEAWGNVEFRQKLSALHPDGSPISAWQKFVNSVKNFMRSMIGMEHKSIESAFDRTDRLMEAIISPAPGMRTAGSLYMMAANPSATSAFFNSMGQAYNKIPYFSTETKDAFRNVFSARIPDAIRRFLLSALPANALSDVAESVLPMARQFDKLVHLKSGQEGKLYSEVEPTINRVRDWAKKQSADTITTFNKVVYDSTINRVDPSKPRSAYVDKHGNSLTDPSGNKLADAWDDLQPLWKELQKNGGA